MTPFLALLAGHLMGDWVIQTDWQAANKTTSWRANLSHVTTYHLAVLAFTLPVWHTRSLIPAMLVSFATHAFIDRRWPVKALLRATGSPGFAEQAWGVVATDQALHITVLILVSAWAPRVAG